MTGNETEEAFVAQLAAHAAAQVQSTLARQVSSEECAEMASEMYWLTVRWAEILRAVGHSRQHLYDLVFSHWFSDIRDVHGVSRIMQVLGMTNYGSERMHIDDQTPSERTDWKQEGF